MPHNGERRWLDPIEELRLARAAASGDKRARARLVEAHLPLVQAIAQHFRGLGLPLADLIQEGSIGLVQAVDRYDPGRGTRLAAYAAWWIRQAIMRALSDQSRVVRLPHYLVANQIAVRRAAAALQARTGREPTIAELAAETGLAGDVVATALTALEVRDSLDGWASADAEPSRSAPIDFVEDASAPDPVALAEEDVDHAELRTAVDGLRAREREVIRRRFGLNGDSGETLEEIAADLGITRERVRQIEQHALAKLALRLDAPGKAATPLRDVRARPAGEPRWQADRRPTSWAQVLGQFPGESERSARCARHSKLAASSPQRS
jgi:RNA polymerase primary sigma factor